MLRGGTELNFSIGRVPSQESLNSLRIEAIHPGIEGSKVVLEDLGIQIRSQIGMKAHGFFTGFLPFSKQAKGGIFRRLEDDDFPQATDQVQLSLTVAASSGLGNGIETCQCPVNNRKIQIITAMLLSIR